MAKLYLVRHGKAAAGWDADADPGLDDVGRRQAEEVADRFADVGPLPILVSPLRRTRETAEAFTRRWQCDVTVEPLVGEIPSPTDQLAARGEWLRGFMASTWSDQPDELKQWRTAVLDRLLAVDEDTLVVSHFIAINAAVGEATGDDRVVSFTPDNCSLTVLDNEDGRLAVVELGGEARTAVL